MESVSQATESRDGVGQGRAKEGSSGRPEEAHTAQFTELRSPGAQQHGSEAVCGYFSAVTPDRENSHARKTAGKARRVDFGVTHTLFPDTPVNAGSAFISKTLFNELFIDTFVLLLYNRIMMNSWLQIMTGTNLYWLTTFRFWRLLPFFPFNF